MILKDVKDSFLNLFPMVLDNFLWKIHGMGLLVIPKISELWWNVVFQCWGYWGNFSSKNAPGTSWPLHLKNFFPSTKIEQMVSLQSKSPLTIKGNGLLKKEHNQFWVVLAIPFTPFFCECVTTKLICYFDCVGPWLPCSVSFIFLTLDLLRKTADKYKD